MDASQIRLRDEQQIPHEMVRLTEDLKKIYTVFPAITLCYNPDIVSTIKQLIQRALYIRVTAFTIDDLYVVPLCSRCSVNA